jgi:RecA/RadA recombinase
MTKKADKKKKEKVDPPKTVQELVNMLNKKLGIDAIKLAKDIEGTYLIRRPCGIFSIDLATAAGLPAGTMNKIGGAEGLGKNYLADLYMSECQRLYGDKAKIFIASSEYPYDKLRGRDNGFRIALTPHEVDQLEASLERGLEDEERKELLAQTGEILLIQGLDMEKTLESVLNCLESNLFHVGLIDSMDSLIPEEQQDRDIGDPRLGSSAIVQTDFMKRFHYAIGKSRKTMLLTLGQARANISTGGGLVKTKTKVNDPHAVKHGLVGKITLGRGDYIRQSGESGARIGKVIRWVIEKGKAGFHEGPGGELNYYYATGIDKAQDFVDTAKQYIPRRGRYIDIPVSDGTTEVVGSLDEFKQYVLDHPEEVEFIKHRIYEQKEIAYSYVEVNKGAGRQGRKKASKKAGRKADK